MKTSFTRFMLKFAYTVESLICIWLLIALFVMLGFNEAEWAIILWPFFPAFIVYLVINLVILYVLHRKIKRIP